MTEYCEPLPFFTIADLLGLETDDQPRLSKLYKDAIAANPLETGPEQMDRSLAAREEFTAMLEPIVTARRRHPTDDFISQLVTARSGDDALSDDEVLGFLRFMLPAGEESTMSALGTLVFELLRHPDQCAAVGADPACLMTAVEEGLRWRAPIAYVNRLTLADQTRHGVEIPAGSLVLGAVNGANRDEGVFEEPDRFDVTRSPNRHIAFGTGVHNCIGAPLARAELRVGVAALLAELPNLRLAPDYEPVYQGLFSNALASLEVEFDPA
jgi:cytochrome P450